MVNSLKLDIQKQQSFVLIYTAFIAGLCSIIYELLIATTVSYFLGDSVKYFSLTIGMYMAAMGLGSLASKYIDDELLHKFVIVEITLGLLGGLSIPVLYFAYAYTNLFIPTYVFFTLSIGFLIGLEIPFLTRLMEDYNKLKFNIANILSFDYFGALIATTSFPFILLPFFGVYQSSLIFGLVNMSIGFAVLLFFSEQLGQYSARLKKITAILTIFIIAMIFFSDKALKQWDNALYEDRVIFSKQSKYQKIVLTKYKEDVRLFLDGNLQFSSVDEHRYHESLVHVPMSLQSTNIQRVLLLGAGDGIAVREILKYPNIKEIILVDLDNEIIELARENKYISSLNKNSLKNEKVKIITADAFTFLKENKEQFDFIIADLPDPNNDVLSRLYSKQFYKSLRNNLSENGVFVTQATSPYFAKKAFWSIAKTIDSQFDNIYPYHAEIPSFGNWGFIMASSIKKDIQNPDIAIDTKFIDERLLEQMFIFPKDMIENDVKINTIDNPILLNYYLNSWKYYAR